MDQQRPSRKSVFFQSEGRKCELQETTLNVSLPNNQIPHFTDSDLSQLIDYLTEKGTRIHSRLGKNKLQLQKFKKLNMKENVFMNIALRKILYDMSNERRIGSELKGISKTLVEEIETKIWDLVTIELKIKEKNEQQHLAQKHFISNLNEQMEEITKLT